MSETSAEWFNIALLPSERDTKVLEDMSDSIQGSTLVLGKPCLPHVSVYQAQFPNIETITGVIEDMRRGIGALTLSLQEFGTPGAGFIFADTDLPPALKSLHANMLQELAPVRIPMSEEALAQLSASRPPQQIKNLHQYGMALADSDYRPHSTIGLVKPRDENGVLRALRKQFSLPIRILCDRLAILDCDAGNGSAKTVHTEWRLTT